MQRTPVVKQTLLDPLGFQRTLTPIQEFSTGMETLNTVGNHSNKAENVAYNPFILNADIVPVINEEQHVQVCDFLQKLKASMQRKQYISFHSKRIYR